MPRGIPNVKRDDTQGMRYTSFHVPLQPNPKHMSTSYLKSESQTLWARKAARQRAAREDTSSLPSDARRGSQVIVIHPGSRFLRIGRASDMTPASIPNVIARKTQPPAPSPIFVESITRPRKSRPKPVPSSSEEDEQATPAPSDDPFDDKISVIQVSLRDRMRFYKLYVTPGASTKATSFNEQFKPEIIAEENDPFRIQWIQEPTEDPYLVGENALRLADPAALGYVVRWPILGTKFNTRDYPSNQLIIDDIEAIIRTTLQDKFDIQSNMYKDYSVILVIPDFYDRPYVRDMVQLLLMRMGFKQLCAQQESLAATYGAGISSACVVDIGATTTSIACVDEGMVIPDTRMYLNMGGDSITEFLYVLLERICFPYRDIDLARSYDWSVIEDLKARLCTLAEGDVNLNLYDFVVRQPGQPTAKYGLRAYDEIILAPMCLFEPRVIDFDRRRIGTRAYQHPDVSDEISDHREHRDPLPADQYTQAMIISTQHLFAPPETAVPALPLETQELPASGAQTPSATGKQEGSPPTASDAPPEGSGAASVESGASVEPKAATPPMDVDGEVAVKVQAPDEPDAVPAPRFDLDIAFEASKLPMDVAIFNSTRAAGGDDRIRKYLQAVLVVGGTALVPGMAHALESRLQAIATPLVANMDKVQIIPPPKDVDPRVLVWKGAAVLGKMDGVADLWLTAADWDLLGMRGLRERCFYL
ncbi:actin-like ATPase domain-containing protein [Artomyces pyxidatus]|uniref:Actin-like ATPase domain-containing protein n=1 Tax=Artomyces pyxidatus TaxID=48021 RepID=A0ACB8T775_9AGAM|nr:actin-like ATPase domain-containing protein [Artomyces pyxidatus]